MTEVGVPRELIDHHGAMKCGVAEAMALGACRCAGSTYALSTTGSRSGAELTKSRSDWSTSPLAGLDKSVEVVKCNFPGNRLDFKTRATTAALNLLRLRLLQK